MTFGLTWADYLIRPASLILLGNSQLSRFNPCFSTRSASRVRQPDDGVEPALFCGRPGTAVLGVWTGWQCPCYGLAATLGSPRSMRAPSGVRPAVNPLQADMIPAISAPSAAPPEAPCFCAARRTADAGMTWSPVQLPHHPGSGGTAACVRGIGASRRAGRRLEA